MDYNLLEEEWLPVLLKNGNNNRVGIIEALTHSHQISQIAASNPMDRVAILRFLLALLYWCQGNPPDQIPASFPTGWFKKLHDYKDCFNLLGNGKRFYQCQAGHGKDGKLPTNYLIQEVPTGTNFWHFRHSLDKFDGLCRACCAMGLLRLPLFATSGGRGKPPGINAKPPIYVIPVGSSLAETLQLSWRQASSPNLGTPAWEKPDLQLPQRGEVPLLAGLTWLPRRVWLDNPIEPEACCISCGRKQQLIRESVFAGIGSTKSDEPRTWSDPHVIYDSKDVVKPGNALGASDAMAGQWAKITAGILHRQQIGETYKLWVVGFSTVQNDKYLETMEYEIPFPSKPVDQQLQEHIEKIERWRKEGSNLTRMVRPQDSLNRKRKHIEISPMIAAIRPHVEGRVSAETAGLLARGEDAWEQAAREYSPMMAAIARSLSPGYTTAALKWRKEIAAVKPNMQSNTRTSKQPAGKKGEEK